MEFLKGRKTYLIAALMILVGVINALTGDAGGWQMVMDNAMIVLGGLGFAGIRAGITNG